MNSEIEGKETNPYDLWCSNRIIRRLISIEECGKIAKRRKIVKNVYDFQYFIQYLIDHGYVKIFTTHNKYSTDIRFNRGFYLYENAPEEIPYFHPLQLMQIIDLFYSNFIIDQPRFEDVTSQKYLFNQERNRIIKDRK
ncbi:MAG: hypothetical protein K9W44_06610 [Candidatus Lokiarchaeota archaeon]|nr:hypothetical protein [Candidatus Harpocratesius repetitus]